MFQHATMCYCKILFTVQKSGYPPWNSIDPEKRWLEGNCSFEHVKKHVSFATVDGRSPAPVDMVKPPLMHMVLNIPGGCLGCLPSFQHVGFRKGDNLPVGSLYVVLIAGKYIPTHPMDPSWKSLVQTHVENAGFVVPDIYRPLMMCNANRSLEKGQSRVVWICLAGKSSCDDRLPETYSKSTWKGHFPKGNDRLHWVSTAPPNGVVPLPKWPKWLMKGGS